MIAMKYSILFFLILLFSFSRSQYFTGLEIDSIETNSAAYEGDLYLDTVNKQYYIGLSHGKLGKVFPYGSSVCDLLKPSINDKTYKSGISSTTDLTLTGYNFTGSSLTVSISGVTINNTTIVNNTEVIVNITTAATTDTVDIVISNSCGSDTITDGLQILNSTWKDLRLGGDAFTTGNGAGNDIRYRTGMNVVRNANGMYFTGSNPWQSWVKFESCQFTRGSGTTVEWIFSHDNTFMIGIGGLTTDENSNAQYIQGAVLSYFNGTANYWGLYGSSPTNGTNWNQGSGQAITSNTVYKLKIENDGSSGNDITLYQLPSANPADWDDESTVIHTITSTNANTQTPLVPFIIPRNSVNNYFIALKVL